MMAIYSTGNFDSIQFDPKGEEVKQAVVLFLVCFPPCFYPFLLHLAQDLLSVCMYWVCKALCLEIVTFLTKTESLAFVKRLEFSSLSSRVLRMLAS